MGFNIRRNFANSIPVGDQEGGYNAAPANFNRGYKRVQRVSNQQRQQPFNDGGGQQQQRPQPQRPQPQVRTDLQGLLGMGGVVSGQSADGRIVVATINGRNYYFDTTTGAALPSTPVSGPGIPAPQGAGTPVPASTGPASPPTAGPTPVSSSPTPAPPVDGFISDGGQTEIVPEQIGAPIPGTILDGGQTEIVPEQIQMSPPYNPEQSVFDNGGIVDAPSPFEDYSMTAPLDPCEIDPNSPACLATRGGGQYF